MALGAQEYEDFSGGITDFYLDCPVNQYRRADNLVITADKQLETRPGFEFFLTSPRVPIASRIGNLFNLKENYLFAQSSRKLYEVNTSWNLISFVNDAFASATTTASFVSSSEWNFQVFYTSDDLVSKPFKVYKDETNTTRIRTAGLPALANPSVTIATPGTSNSYIHAVHLVYRHKVGSNQVEYIDLGPVSYGTSTSGAPIGAGNAATVTLPTLTNGGATTNDNYDIANLAIQIYRTLANGEVPFFLAEVALGTASYNDTTDDSTISDNAVIYNIAERDNDPPPKAKFVHVVGDVTLWANVLEADGTHRPFRIRQSKESDPDSCPALFFTDVDDEIVGVSSFKSKPIIFCSRLIYRLDGIFDPAGRGDVIPQKIAEVVGCVGHNSIVQTEYGVFWIAPEGAYYSDGYQVTPVSKHLPNSFRDWLVEANYKKIYGSYDSYNKRIWWAFGKTSNENTDALILDLKFGISEQMPFTTASGNSFATGATTFFQKNLVRAHTSGYLFKSSLTVYTDPKVEVLVSPSSWNVETLIWDFVSGATPAGSKSMRKIFPRIVFQAKNETNLSLQINGINDDGRSTLPCNAIVFRNNVLWGDDDVIWGDADVIWNYQGIIEAMRRFSSGGLRASYKQVQFTNAYVVIANSRTFGQVTSNNSLNTVVLNDPTYEWTASAVDYFISLSNDNYEKEYKVLSRTPTTLTLEDINDSLPNGSYDFYLKGYKKNEKFSLLTYSLIFNSFSVSQDPSNGSFGANDG